MKYLEHTYTNMQNLKQFMQDSLSNGNILVQLFCNDKTAADNISREIQLINKSSTINIIVSTSYKKTKLYFTFLPQDADTVSHINPLEHELFHSGPIVIFKREFKNGCWVVTNVTNSVSQWGYEPSFFLNNKEAVKNILHKDDIQRVQDTLTNVVDNEKNQINQQYRIYKTDGTIAWVSDYIQVFRNSKGEAVELIGYLVDITQDKKHEALYACIINTTTEGFWLLNSDLKIVDVNYSLCAMLEYRKDEMIGKSPYEFISKKDHKLFKSQIDSADNMPSHIYEITLKTKKSKLIYTLVNATTMYDQYGRIKTFAFMTDISNKKKIEDDLRKKQEDIEILNNSLESRVHQEVEKNREKDQMMYQQARLASMGEMIGNIAHQWRQPLNIMALVMQDIYISYQLGNLTSKKIEESYEKSNNLLQYMSQTIDDFRNFFKQEAEDTSFSVKEAIGTVYSLVSTNLSYNHIECEINIEQDSDIKGGINKFKQVLVNIINNAQEAIIFNNSEDKAINIHVTQNESNAIISITDTGGGISENVIDKIFDPYFTTKNKTQGTGLGLYMSKHIIENSMFGSLSAKNIEKGVKFIITVPLNICSEDK